MVLPLAFQWMILTSVMWRLFLLVQIANNWQFKKLRSSLFRQTPAKTKMNRNKRHEQNNDQLMWPTKARFADPKKTLTRVCEEVPQIL